MTTIKLKGTKNLILSLFTIGFLSALTLWAFKSWSDSDGSPMDSFLVITLGCIEFSLWSLSYAHKQASKIMFSIKKINIRLRHLDRYTAVGFLGIAAFGVNGEWYSTVAHFAFTIISAALLTIRIIKYYPDKKRRIIWITLISVANFIWVLGFLTHLWKVGLGEYIFYLVAVASILSQFKEID